MVAKPLCDKTILVFSKYILLNIRYIKIPCPDFREQEWVEFICNPILFPLILYTL